MLPGGPRLTKQFDASAAQFLDGRRKVTDREPDDRPAIKVLPALVAPPLPPAAAAAAALSLLTVAVAVVFVASAQAARTLLSVPAARGAVRVDPAQLFPSFWLVGAWRPSRRFLGRQLLVALVSRSAQISVFVSLSFFFFFSFFFPFFSFFLFLFFLLFSLFSSFSLLSFFFSFFFFLLFFFFFFFPFFFFLFTVFDKLDEKN